LVLPRTRQVREIELVKFINTLQNGQKARFTGRVECYRTLDVSSNFLHYSGEAVLSWKNPESLGEPYPYLCLSNFSSSFMLNITKPFGF